MTWLGRTAASLFGAALASLYVGPSVADTASDGKAFARLTEGLARRPGLLPVYLDAAGAKILLELDPDASGDCGRYVYQVSMRAGLGSTPVGIDRSNPGPARILHLRRFGSKLVAELENQSFRAEQGGPDEVAAVHESFPASIIWSAPVAAEKPGGAFVVDISSFLTRDGFGVIDALRSAKQGAFHLAEDRSFPDVAAAQSFPENLELEARQTFVSDEPGDQVRGIAPEPHAVTLVEHHSLIKLPPPGFTPRLADPRTGAINEAVVDYGAPLGSPIVYRLASRFRLEKTDPRAARSPVKKPIVFYVDRAAPEPIRSALVEGARWWAQAFDAAGFVDAFRVEVLPEGINPLDARYNVINWVHRQTRGWSYGDPVTDPRTGEIIKGSVLLGSLRVRQDRMIFEGLVGADRTGTGAQDDPIQVSLARLRQLAVHETGHALGLEHNFAGSTFDDRASVMDYPAPRIRLNGDRFDFRDAYKVGIGSWDRFAIKWLYSELPSGAPGAAALEAIVRDGYAQGLRYVRDDDARPIGSAHPEGALWDDGPDSIAELAHVMQIRRLALARFGPANIPAGAPISDLRRVIVPIYLFHRYEIEAVAKSIGGVDFRYSVRGDGAPPARPVDAGRQRVALTALLATLEPTVLDLPDPLIATLSAGRDGAPDPQFDTEVFGDPHAPVFDLGAAADAAADITWRALLDPTRLARVADQGSRGPVALGVDEVLASAVHAAFAPPHAEPARERALRRRVQMRLIVRLAMLLQDKDASPAVTVPIRGALAALVRGLAAQNPADAADAAQARYLSDLIGDRSHDGLAALAMADRGRAAVTPPGMPIGEEAGEGCWFCKN